MSNVKLILLLYHFAILTIWNSRAENNSNYISFPASENGTCYKRVPYDDALAANISKGLIKTVPNSQQAGIKTSNNRAWITIIDCCDGFKRNPTTDQCETHCDAGCFGGACTGPNICTCEDGWYPVAGVCKPKCRRQCAENAYCFAPDVCTCKYGYEEIEGICKPVCLHNCSHGDCLAPRICRCHRGYFLNETQQCEPVCEGGCAHGVCREPGVCSCDNGYHKHPNDPEVCVPSCPDTCVNGQCLSPNMCTCNPGYTEDRATGGCNPVCANECTNGRCVAPNQCECNRGFAMDWKSQKCVESSQLNYESRGTIRPEVSSQLHNLNDPLNRQRINQTYSSVPYAKAQGTQGVIQNRNQPSSGAQNVYGADDRYEIYRSGVKETNHSRGSYRNRDPYGNYGADEEPEPQRYIPTQDFNQTSGSRRDNVPYGGYGTNQTYENKGRFPEQGPYLGQGSQGRISGQGPFPALPTQRPQILHGQSPTTNSYNVDRAYGLYDNNQTRQTQGRVSGQGPFQSQGPYPRDPYGRNDPYGNDGNNETYRSWNPSTPQSRPMYKQTPNSRESNGPYRPYDGSTTQYPVLMVVMPGTNQDPNRLNDPYAFHRSNQDHGRSPYDSRGSSNPHPGLDRQPGVKGGHGRPEIFPLYGRPEGSQPGYLGVDLAYGVNELHPPQNNKPFNDQRLNPSHGDNRNTYDPYDKNNHRGGDGIAVSYSNTDRRIPVDGQYGPTCDPPCWNSDCIAENVCMCKVGYEPDQRDRRNNKCIPICHGGCLNGICSAPNLCLCNVGFRKEHGIKGAQRCVPAN